ncbi:hypothetical protein TELCIR_18730, partial [Teladorsagia circumcincta]
MIGTVAVHFKGSDLFKEARKVLYNDWQPQKRMVAWQPMKRSLDERQPPIETPQYASRYFGGIYGLKIAVSNLMTALRAAGRNSAT